MCIRRVCVFKGVPTLHCMRKASSIRSPMFSKMNCWVCFSGWYEDTACDATPLLSQMENPAYDKDGSKPSPPPPLLPKPKIKAKVSGEWRDKPGLFIPSFYLTWFVRSWCILAREPGTSTSSKSMHIFKGLHGGKGKFKLK